ncbi:MAG: hypothetical protein IJY97_04510 [Clostridia bacterium]|nr:hypothetical protein [Clostridia bacterium]
MRKTLSIILCVMMLLSACSFAIPASAAPEGTAINTADEFMAMVSTPADATEPTAKYYLASDITLAGTYAEPFWGILDGNGKTLTVTNPVFADFSGEVSNLTIKGEIYYTDADAAGFAVASSRGYKATKVTNNANVTVMGNGKHIGGFSARIVNNTELGIPAECWFVDCVNNGNLYIDSTANEKMRAGGFSGILDLSHFSNCTNNGNIYMKGNICIGAGFVGRVALTKGMNGAEAFSCVNNGNVVVEDTYTSKDGVAGAGTAGADAGGFFGYIGGSGNAGWYKIWGCTNNGDITGPYRVGGMVGYVYASGSTAFVDIQFCINAGNLTYGRIAGGANTATNDYCGPFVGYTNSPFTTIKYCIDTGTITLVENSINANDGRSFCGLSSADGTQYDIKSVYVLNKEQYKWVTYSHNPSYVANCHEINTAEGIIVTTLEDIKSGKVAYLINEAAVKDDYGFASFDSEDYAWAGYKSGDTFGFTQKIGTDNYPAGNTGSANWVVLNGDKYANGEKSAATTAAPETQAPETQAPETQAPETQAPETQAPAQDTEAPVATDAPTTEPAPAKKGCGGMIAGGVAIIAIIGTALIIKKED